MGNRTLWQLGLCAALFLAAMAVMPSPSIAQDAPGCTKAAEGANCRKTCRAIQPPYRIAYEALLQGACGSTKHPLILEEINHIGGCNVTANVCNFVRQKCVEELVDNTCIRTCHNVDTGEQSGTPLITPAEMSPYCTAPRYERDPNYSLTCSDPNVCPPIGGWGPEGPPPGAVDDTPVTPPPGNGAEVCTSAKDPSNGGCILTCVNPRTLVITRAEQVDCKTSAPVPNPDEVSCIEITEGNGQHCKKQCNNKSTGELVSTTITYNGPCGTPPDDINPEDVICEEDKYKSESCMRHCISKYGGSISTHYTPGDCPDDGPTGDNGGGDGGAGAGDCGGGAAVGCCETCTVEIPAHHDNIRAVVSEDFKILRQWMITQYFRENILPALMLMAEQLTVAGQYQVQAIGSIFDAKHQLETQRIFQQLSARAHKDYQPSEGMCTIATGVRSLATSDRKANMATTAVATRMMQRQTLSGMALSHQGSDPDKQSRQTDFVKIYCNPGDNQRLLSDFCKSPTAARRNIDIDFTRNIESRLTLDMELLDSAQNPDATKSVTPDEQDVFAISANLFAHNVVTPIGETLFGEGETFKVRMSVAEEYMRLRSIFAKRSVAQNSFAALVGMRTAGEPGVAPFVKAAVRELGIRDPEEIEKLVGKNPSYFAQMELLTKKLYQNPQFYSDLYDKPVNVERKAAALDAIGLMQDRDFYNSLIRSEAVLAVLLETRLAREQEKVTSQKGALGATGDAK